MLVWIFVTIKMHIKTEYIGNSWWVIFERFQCCQQALTLQHYTILFKWIQLQIPSNIEHWVMRGKNLFSGLLLCKRMHNIKYFAPCLNINCSKYNFSTLNFFLNLLNKVNFFHFFAWNIHTCKQIDFWMTKVNVIIIVAYIHENTSMLINAWALNVHVITMKVEIQVQMSQSTS